jgi:queuine/archaeosine tRNA-ribosyltransferase
MQDAREAIRKGKFLEFKKKVERNYNAADKDKRGS